MTEGWPFLIGRARLAGQRVVVAPEVIADEPSLAWLAGVSRGPNTPAGSVVAHHSPDGTLTALARVFPATHAHYDLPGEGPLRDRSGRPIRLTVGVLVRRDHPLTEADLTTARTATADAYRAFWAEDESYRLRRSGRVPLPGDGPALTALGADVVPRVPAPDRPPPPPGRGGRRILGGVIGFLALALLVGVVSVVLSATGGGDPPTTTVPAPSSAQTTPGNKVPATPVNCRRGAC